MAVGSMRAVSLLMVSLSGCGNTTADEIEAPEWAPAQANGYAGIELGSSLERALSQVDGGLYRAADIATCSTDMPLKGCVLIWNDWAVPFVRKDGIPYRLNLEFNRQGALERINLVYSRREDDISASDCLNISERTVDWVKSEYGPLERSSLSPMHSPDFMFVMTRDFSRGDGRSNMSVFFVSHFLRGSCQVNVSFADAVAK